MKIDLFNVYKLNLTPNQLYLLLCKARSKEAKLVNIALEERLLMAGEFLDGRGDLTAKGFETLSRAEFESKKRATATKATLTSDDIDYVSKYRELWPAIKIPTSGKLARTSVRELTEKFIWFFTNYPQYRNWELIGQATGIYLYEAELKKYQYMTTSEYFISKSDMRTGTVKSELANFCQMIEEEALNESQPQQTKRASLVNIPGLTN
jgi:hypothetical protein